MNRAPRFLPESSEAIGAQWLVCGGSIHGNVSLTRPSLASTSLTSPIATPSMRFTAHLPVSR
jgi:hypothetical protein